LAILWLLAFFFVAEAFCGFDAATFFDDPGRFAAGFEGFAFLEDLAGLAAAFFFGATVFFLEVAIKGVQRPNAGRRGERVIKNVSSFAQGEISPQSQELALE
jgi:hypothetical protein